MADLQSRLSGGKNRKYDGSIRRLDDDLEYMTEPMLSDSDSDDSSSDEDDSYMKMNSLEQAVPTESLFGNNPKAVSLVFTGDFTMQALLSGGVKLNCGACSSKKMKGFIESASLVGYSNGAPIMLAVDVAGIPGTKGWSGPVLDMNGKTHQGVLLASFSTKFPAESPIFKTKHEDLSEKIQTFIANQAPFLENPVSSAPVAAESPLLEAYQNMLNGLDSEKQEVFGQPQPVASGDGFRIPKDSLAAVRDAASKMAQSLHYSNIQDLSVTVSPVISVNSNALAAETQVSHSKALLDAVKTGTSSVSVVLEVKYRG